MSSILMSDSASLRQQPVPQSRFRGHPQASRPTTTGTAVQAQQVIGAVIESRGVSPTVGLAFVNLSTSEVVLCQLCDTNSYVKTLNKVAVFEPTELLLADTRRQSKLHGIIRENIPELVVTAVDRRFWSDKASHEYVEKLAIPDELNAIRLSLESHYFASCCLAAVGVIIMIN